MSRADLHRRRLLVLFICTVLCPAPTVFGKEPNLKPVNGRVVDAAGDPVAGAKVGVYWSANGLKLSRLQQILEQGKLHGKEPDLVEMYGQQGIMEPWGDHPTQTDEQGRFRLITDEGRHWAMVIDASQRRGGIVAFPDDRSQPVEVRLAPLVRVYGTVRAQQWETQPEWAAVLINLPRSDRFPLAPTRLALCGTLDRRFEFLLPPGEYVFEANTDQGERFAELVKEKRFRLVAGQGEYDAGTLDLVERANTTRLIEQAKARKTWFDFREHYGEPAPRLYVTEARGVPRDVQLADFKGKWVLVYFWSPWCRPCLAKGVPELMDFYGKHAGQPDRFQILSVCIDKDNDFKTLKGMDEYLDPVVRNVWRRPIDFPVLLDTTFRTFESFGIKGAGDMVLVDPDGNLSAGDLSTLAEILSQ